MSRLRKLIVAAVFAIPSLALAAQHVMDCPCGSDCPCASPCPCNGHH